MTASLQAHAAGGLASVAILAATSFQALAIISAVVAAVVVPTAAAARLRPATVPASG